MQKFFRGDRVRIVDKMPTCMSHFTCGIEAIVMYSYSDIHGKESNNSYSLLLLDKTTRTSAWYPEDLLTLLDDDRRCGDDITVT